MSVIDNIAEMMSEKIRSFSDQVQNFLNSADLSNPAVLTQLQLFANKLSMYTNLNSTMTKIFGDMAKTTIHNML